MSSKIQVKFGGTPKIPSQTGTVRECDPPEFETGAKIFTRQDIKRSVARRKDSFNQLCFMFLGKQR